MTETIKKRKPSRPSSITMLDPAVKEAVDTAVREGRLTIDQIVALIASQGGDASRSAVGRYVKTANERLEEYRQAQQMAAVWMDKIGKEPDGDVGRMLLEMLRMLAFKSLGELDSASPEDLMFLSNAIKGFAQTDKLVVDKTINLRKLMAIEAAKVATEVVKTVKKAGLSDDTVEAIRSKILGIPEAKKAAA
ncbi:phage protein Gp27 family protein [Rhodoferax sp.]|uniref:phage protein Gp27 family protein n=1 Tax=Rhodoferax sp. TaxID=50421 RepID=UPI002ACEB3E1|nr:phage protein Gp27 family protein [Rhodoferax sp.]MDZ7920746.1 phage protein Gp27 family protein [Rhodoferax sp.]